MELTMEFFLDKNIIVKSEDEARQAIDVMQSAGCFRNPAYTLDEFVSRTRWDWTRTRYLYIDKRGQIDHSVYAHSNNKLDVVELCAMFVEPVSPNICIADMI